jgi:ketosteroid isomerase-like protein
MVVRLTGTMSEEQNLRFVRELWEVIEEHGVEAALERTDPEVEWKPHPADGRVLTSGELLRFFREFQGEREFLEAKPYSFRAKGDLVLASGSFRLRGPDRLSEFQIHWVYEFENGSLVRATSYAKRTEALEAIGLTETPQGA